MSRGELLALPASIDVETAGRALGLGRTTAYALTKSGEFPCAVIRAGRSYRVVTQDLLQLLHITPENSDGARSSHPAPSDENSSVHQR
ncbi:helix-turn-helix domain-containing protein [Streptomyces sp. NBC_01571]|uniref:helix-turn-helix transcriptional regulator n=1 Tax=Streptomyces sp. NBC_01571 TaxID=2975883 RepID=UPI0022572D5B|nr:helix-turn-helix domain-containing protein [Streptomyces sp. NBC_01571]MCX4576564.1 helix-turn-helix domain-containing protein [Streptomyces sp. NBC_01571]